MSELTDLFDNLVDHLTPSSEEVSKAASVFHDHAFGHRLLSKTKKQGGKEVTVILPDPKCPNCKGKFEHLTGESFWLYVKDAVPSLMIHWFDRIFGKVTKLEEARKEKIFTLVHFVPGWEDVKYSSDGETTRPLTEEEAEFAAEYEEGIDPVPVPKLGLSQITPSLGEDPPDSGWGIE